MINVKSIPGTCLLLLFLVCSGKAQKLVEYKQIDTTNLLMEIYSPPQMITEKTYPAMVFFFGGGWNGGTRTQFLEHAKYLSQRGIVCFLADYRILNKHQTSPFESLKDAKSAIRYIRKNAAKFNVDPGKVIAAGGSAGGHLAAATATISQFNEASDDLSTSCIPDALVLFNPVIDNGPGGYGFERIGEQYLAFSPLHNLRKGAPPTIFFLGTKDRLIPVATAEYYKTVMDKIGSKCVLKLYEDKGHGFFNYRHFDVYKKTVIAMDEFLQELGYLEAEPMVEIK